ncbi:dihydromonapterin reductase [Enterovibrio norvegicus FF-33]|uniref:Dihydromonapterin reductase n=1 Tax=Enterovibrio norvegicus FF-454 TaxID=1185651 RepID=A0A1E5CBP0_9GAMM|nr:dihydromonapterin reductase [Enterovibrio norvegicus]OEE62943.1 dihydromonapterin reductase [Enterovibrio norvegicus FF-454]OEE66867.1 dihydromonapterin reductase [Enterovibrio norvegicus FF-33]OEE74911.1 dihydromonapterin reductase [Enterovibrio norvegicus FF-162]
MTQNTIVITGAAQRIGFALAKHFVEGGNSVIVSYRTERSGIATLRKMGVECIHADFSTDAGIHQFARTLAERNLTLRALIHNASDWNAEKHTDDYAALLDQMMQVHVKAPYLLNQALAPFMRTDENADSDIIHFTDYVVKKGSAKHIAYAASKAALENLTLSFAQKLAPQVKVNSIAPALIMFNDSDDDNYKRKALSKSLMNLAPGEAEIVNAVEFILNSNYMTGQSVNLDGGRALK